VNDGLISLPILSKRKHLPAEITAMLAQADDLARQGRRQNDIAQTLGVSVMNPASMAQKSAIRDRPI
jgi:hypothetical protein